MLHFQNAEIPDAITYLGRAANANPKDANALWNYGLALAETHIASDNVKSKNALNAALKIDPTLIKTLGTPAKTSAPPKIAGGSGAVKPNGQVATSTTKAP